MRLIPGKTKVQTEIFKGVSIADVIIGFIAVIIFVFLLLSNLPHKFMISVGLFFVTALLLVRIDTEPNYIFLLHMLRHFGYPRRYSRVYSDKMLLSKHEKGERQAGKEMFFEGKSSISREEQRKKEKEARKALRRERKEDDKKLKDKNVSKEEKDAIWLKRAQQSAERSKEKRANKEENADWKDMADLFGFTEIKEDCISFHGEYFGAVIEIAPVEFRFFSASRRNNSIENGVGRVLRSVNPNYAMNLLKIERPIRYEKYRDNEYEKLDTLRAAYEKGMLSEDELKARVEVIYDRIHELDELCEENQVVTPFYYLVLYDSDRKQLHNQVKSALSSLKQAELTVKKLEDKELAVFLKYTNQIDFDEDEINQIDREDYVMWAMPDEVKFNMRTVEVNNILTHNMRVISFPMLASDAWLASMMSIPATKVMVKCKPLDRIKALKGIDRSLSELRAQYRSTGLESKAIELRNHIDSLSELLAMLQNENETLLNVNVYVSMYDLQATRNNVKLTKQPPPSNRAVIANMKKQVRRMYREEGMRMSGMDFEQLNAFIASQVNAYDPCEKQGRGMPSNTISAAYPWIFAHVSDEKGIKLGASEGVPVFIDFFRRDSERVNSNMVIIGKSGSGKSYATKSLLANLAADDSKIFILDPENEYTELANNLHGKFINVGNAQYGRLNPFHIITSMDDDDMDEGTVSGSYATHLQFLEEFFRQILPDCEKDALEYLNSMVDRMYTNMGITTETDLSKLEPEDYPIFDDLYDEILQEFQRTDNEYIRKMLRTLMNYVAKFSTGGRNANIWNGPSTITTDENFSVFNFQSLLANRNTTIANAQMLLVLKYIDNEIIKNRDYNTRNHMNRKIVVVIDEAHVFIDEKFPIALDFMYQLAKRIRKYNGMQIVITQNIKDFLGTEEIARKSTAIINACQYSFVFALAPNDMEDLCKLYEKAGGINEREQEKIMSAPRGQAFTIMSSSSRSTFKVEVPENVVEMFQEQEYESSYFYPDEEGNTNWSNFIGDSRKIRNEYVEKKTFEQIEQQEETKRKTFVNFQEISEEEARSYREAVSEKAAFKTTELPKANMSIEIPDFPEIPDIPETPEEFEALYKPAPVPVPEVVPVPAPAPVPVAIPVPAPQPSKTEQMLAEFIEQFSYDVLMQEIKRTVREELLREMEEKGVLVQQKATEEATSTTTPEYVQETPTEEISIFDSLFGAEDTSEGTVSKEEEVDIFDALFGGTTYEDRLETDSNKDAANMFAFFGVESEDQLSPIETMEMYGDEVIEVTLEELTLYNSNMKRRG